MQYVRICAEGADVPPLWIDAIIDDEDEILGAHALFGFQGWFEKSDEHFEPFVIKSNGRVDWGDGFDSRPNERFGWLDIRDKPIRLNTALTLRADNYNPQSYLITKIISLPAKS